MGEGGAGVEATRRERGQCDTAMSWPVGGVVRVCSVCAALTWLMRYAKAQPRVEVVYSPPNLEELYAEMESVCGCLEP